MAELNLGLPQFEAFLNTLGVPPSCILNQPLFKKMFAEHDELDAKDKKALKEHVDKIRWLYTLKPSTINIAPYQDELREYGEVAVLQVELAESKRNDSKLMEQVGHFINRAIPYPLVIFFTDSQHSQAVAEGNEQLTLCLADKRINQANQEKWVIEEVLLAPSVALADSSGKAKEFLASLQLANLPFSNFWQLYQALISCVVAGQCAEITGRYRVISDSELKQQNDQAHSEPSSHSNRWQSSDQQRQNLLAYQQLEQTIKRLRSQIKKAEFSQQVTLNTQIKQHEQTLKQLAECL